MELTIRLIKEKQKQLKIDLKKMVDKFYEETGGGSKRIYWFY